MDLLEHKELYDEAFDKWGINAQLMVVFEELSELQFAICKSRRPSLYKTDEQKRQGIINEIADVYVMLGQLMVMYRILEIEVEDKYIEKINRLKNMVEKEQSKGED